MKPLRSMPILRRLNRPFRDKGLEEEFLGIRQAMTIRSSKIIYLSLAAGLITIEASDDIAGYAWIPFSAHALRLCLVGFLLAYVVMILIVVVVSIAVGLSFIFSYQLIVERGLSGVDACKLSAKAVWANFGGALGLVLLLVVLGFCGALACYVGAILLIPVHFAAIDAAYRRVFPAVAAPGSPYAPPPPPPQYPNYGDRYPGQ